MDTLRVGTEVAQGWFSQGSIDRIDSVSCEKVEEKILFLYAGRVYRMIGYNFFVKTDDEQYGGECAEVTAIDITDTDEGIEIIAKRNKRKENGRKISAISKDIMAKGTRVMDKAPEGEVVYSNGAKKLIKTNTSYVFVIHEHYHYTAPIEVIEE